MTRLDNDARWLINEIAETKRMAAALAKPQLGTSSIESGRIEEYDKDGNLVQIIGEQHDGTHTTNTVGGPMPPEPAAPAITPGIGSVEARWSGKFADSALSPMDFSHVSLHASRVSVFVPSNDTQLATITGELGDVAVVLIDPGEWTFGLVAVSKAGKWSPLSETVTIDVPDFPTPVDIQDELIRFDEVTGGLITEAGKIGEKLDQATNDLANHEARLGANEGVIRDLKDNVLPTLESSMGNLRDVQFPAMNQRIADAEAEISETGTQLNERLDTAFMRVADAETVSAEAKAAASTAQSKADQASTDAATAAGIAGGKADVLIQSTAPASAMRKATTLWIDTTNGANTPKRWSGTAWVEVTDKAAKDAASAAATAQQKAQDALNAAGSAQDTATNALTMAGTKNAVYYGTTAPTGNGTRQGDLWRRVDATGDVIGEWQWTGTAWAVRMVSSSAISNLDLGKLTAGTAFVSEAVIEKLWAEVIRARKIIADQILVGQGENLIPWTLAGPVSGRTAEGFYQYTASGQPAANFSNSGGVTGTGYLTMPAGGFAAGSLILATSSVLANGAYGWVVEPGEEFYFSAYIHQSAEVRVRVRIYWYTSDGGYLASVGGPAVAVSNSWQKVDVKAAAPATAAFCRVYTQLVDAAPASLQHRVDLPSLYKVSDGNLIATGSITGDHVQGNSVAAKIAQFLELQAEQITSGKIRTALLDVVAIAGETAAFQQVDVANLFVTTGTMSEAVINKLWTDVVHSRKITTQMLAIGSFDNMIPDPTFTNEGGDWEPMNATYSIDMTGSRAGRTALKITRATAAQLGKYTAFMPATPGATYRMTAWVKASGQVPVGGIALYAYIWRISNATGSSANTGSNTSVIPANTWVQITSQWTCPEDSRDMRFGVYSQASVPAGVDVWVDNFTVNRMSDGQLVVDGSIVSKKLDVEDLAANDGFIADLTARIVKSEMFVGKEFQGGTFTGSVFQTSGIANVGLKLDSTGFRAYGPDGGEPVTEIRSDGGTVYSVTDPTTGEVLAAIDSEGGLTGQSLSVAGEVRLDGSVVIGQEPLSSAHGGGNYGATMNGRDMIGAAYMEAVNLHPDMQDGNAWLTMAPHGMKSNAWNSREDNLGPDKRWGWASGEARMMLTATMETWPGRQYLLAYRTPAIRETGTTGTGDLGAAVVRYASGTGVVNANKGNVVPGTQIYLARGGGYQEAAVTTMLRCPEDIPAGRVMFGVEVYTYIGRTAQSTDTPGARRWELSVIDMGMRISENSGEAVDYRTGGVEPPTPDPEPKPKPAREYTDTINATWWQAYTGSGSQATHSTYSGAAAQGRSPYAPTNGVMRGLVGFPSQVARLSNATVKKIEVYVYAKHWHSSAGGTACIGVHNHASAPSSWSSLENDKKRQKLKRPEGRWITLPSSVHAGFKNGDIRGISFLPPSSSTSSEYYGLFKGNRTKLRITYTK